MDAGDATKDIVTSFTYDRNGNLISTTDPLGNVTTNIYNLFDWKTRTTDFLGAYTSYSYDVAGNVTQIQSYNSANILLKKTTSTYDKLGHLLQTTEYDLTNETPVNIVTSAKYDKTGNIIEKTDARGNTTTNTYDSFGRLHTTTDPLGKTTTTTYNKRNLVTGKTITFSGSSYSTSTTYNYNSDGQFTTETDVKNHTKVSTYNSLGQLISLKDENNHVSEYTYDFLGNLLSEKKVLVGSPNMNIETVFTYDTNGNRTSLTDANGNTTSYEYDKLNRKTKETLPDGNFTTYTYDKASNLTSTIDPNGTTTTSAYNTLNRLTAKSIVTGTGVIGTASEAYTYDSLGRLTSTTSIGSTTGTGTTTTNLSFAYDSQNRLVSETQNGTTVSYTYDQNNNRTSIATGTGYLATYTYDSLNRPTEVIYNSGSIANYSYSGIVLDHINLGNGTTTTNTFDELLRLNTLAHSNSSGSFVTRTYTYDSVSNITNDGLKSYNYNSLDELTGANSNSGVLVPNSNETFVYDTMGNRTTSTITTGSSSYSGNILNQYIQVQITGTTNTGTAINTYDKNGNLTSNGTFNFSYDYQNRLVEVKKASDNTTVAEYTYDVLGRRIQSITNTSTTNYIYA